MQEQYVIPMLERAFKILEYMSSRNEEYSLSMISQDLDIPKTTVFRIITTMQKWGYVEKSQTPDTYRLGKSLIKLGKYAAAGIDIKDIALPHLEELSKIVGESTNLGILYEDEVITVANSMGEDFYLISQLIPVSPLNCSAMGKLFLAEFSKKQLEEYFKSSKPQKRTIHSVTNLEDYLVIKEENIKEGFSYDREEYEYGLTCIAAPIPDANGQLIGAVSISAPTSRLVYKGEENLKQELRKTSLNISKDYVDVFQ